MDRYSIALNKHKKVPSPRGHEIESFGFDSEPNYMESVSKRPLPYRPNPGSPLARVGIVFTDPGHMFTATNVHWHNHTFFQCKSTEARKEICCLGLQGNTISSHPHRRIFCPIIVYGFEVLPWVFGNSAFRKLNELNQLRPLNENDFSLGRTDQSFDPWDIRSIPRSESLWQSSPEIRQRVLNAAAPIIENRNRYLGQDMSVFEIRQFLSRPDFRPPAPVQRPRLRRVDLSAFAETDNNRNPPLPRRQRNPNVENSDQVSDLHDLLLNVVEEGQAVRIIPENRPQPRNTDEEDSEDDGA